MIAPDVSGPRSCRLPDELRVGGLVEADHKRAPLPRGGSAQVPGGSEQEAEQLTPPRPLRPEVDVYDLLPPDRVEIVDAVQQRERLVAPNGRLPRVDPRGYLCLLARKEPLRPGTGLSALAVIAPVDARHVISSAGF
jgi:hypothetical protein